MVVMLITTYYFLLHFICHHSFYDFLQYTLCVFLLFFMRMGLPKVITTDQGGEFNNDLNTELMNKLNIKHQLTTPYHPQVSMECFIAM